MPDTTPACPQCGLDNTYPDATLYICPDCAHEWPIDGSEATGDDGGDAGDGATLKKGTKIKGIRLVDGADDHNVDCKTDLGSLLLKSEFLKKA